MISGMTLQDWFAGQIIASMMGSDPSCSTQRDDNGQLSAIDPKRLTHIARNAYQAAEALMSVRAAALKKSTELKSPELQRQA